MKQTYTILFVGVSAMFTAAAQTSNPLSTDVKQTYTAVKNNLLKAAEKMPEEDYSFKPSPDIRTFGALVAHIADAQMSYCAAIRGEEKRGSASSKTAKADIVAALKDSIAYCDTVYDGLTDETGKEMVKTRRGEAPRLGIAIRNVIHDNEEYGYLAVYLRLKAIVPPSSEGR